MMEKTDIKSQQEVLNKVLLEENILVDGKRILPVSLSPYLLNSKQYQHLSYLCQHVINALEKFIKLCVNNELVRALYPELKNYYNLASKKPNYERWIHLARFDLVATAKDNFKLLETNCDCPGAIQFTPIIKKIFKYLSFESIVSGEILPQIIDDEYYFLNSLAKLDCFRGDTPTIAFFNSAYRTISSDLNLLQKFGEMLGLKCHQTTIQQLQLSNNRVCVGNTPIDIAYQKFDAFIDKDNQVKPCIYEKSTNEVSAYWHGVMNNKMTVVNSFPSALIAENKRTLAMLLLPEFQKYFTQEENEAIKMLLPRSYDLCSCDKATIEEIYHSKDQFVIKKAIDTRGRCWMGGVGFFKLSSCKPKNR